MLPCRRGRPGLTSWPRASLNLEGGKSRPRATPQERTTWATERRASRSVRSPHAESPCAEPRENHAFPSLLLRAALRFNADACPPFFPASRASSDVN